jgi:hypothetical protein
MEETRSSALAFPSDVVIAHLRLHMRWGAVGSVLMMVVIVVTQHTGQDWQNALYAVVVAPILSLVGATLVGVMRLPFLHWVVRQAQQQHWPLALLLLASAVLFLAPIMPLFLFGTVWSTVGKLSLVLSLPFLVSYVVATYKLRQSIYAPA